MLVMPQDAFSCTRFLRQPQRLAYHLFHIDQPFALSLRIMAEIRGVLQQEIPCLLHIKMRRHLQHQREAGGDMRGGLAGTSTSNVKVA